MPVNITIAFPDLPKGQINGTIDCTTVQLFVDRYWLRSSSRRRKNCPGRRTAQSILHPLVKTNL